jgi:NTP pyrophosphatase (non-canonical NTP hydrolase)
MNFSEYQEISHRTSNSELDKNLAVAIAGLGLTGEAGEAADLLKKYLGHGHELDLEKLDKELGDILWYVAEIASLLDRDLSDIASKNVEKLKKRYPQGFNTQDSIARRDLNV